jgi:hypothetical protein
MALDELRDWFIRNKKMSKETEETVRNILTDLKIKMNATRAILLKGHLEYSSSMQETLDKIKQKLFDERRLDEATTKELIQIADMIFGERRIMIELAEDISLSGGLTTPAVVSRIDSRLEIPTSPKERESLLLLMHRLVSLVDKAKERKFIESTDVKEKTDAGTQ